MNSLKNLKYRLSIYKNIHHELNVCVSLSLKIRKKLTRLLPEEVVESYDLISSFKKLESEEKDILKKTMLVLDDDVVMKENLQKLIALMADFLRDYNKEHYLTDELNSKFIKILDFVIKLDSQFSKKEVHSEDFLIKVKHILSASPDSVFNQGYLFRGVSSKELILLKHGYPIESHIENKNTLEGHVSRRCDEANIFSRFISLTTKREVAEHFGNLVIVDKRKLVGNLLTPDSLSKKLSSESHRFIKKNEEFILEPSFGKPASIPSSSVIWFSRAA